MGGTVALSASTLLSACSNKESSGSVSASPKYSEADVDAALEQPTKLTFWAWEPCMKEIVPAFMKKYPKVQVDLQTITGVSQYQKMGNVIQAGSGIPDIAQVEYFALPQFIYQKALYDLTQVSFRSMQSTFTTSAWDSVNILGGLYALPSAKGPVVMFYRKDIFNSLGISVPKTWDDYKAAAKAVQQSDSGKWIGNSGWLDPSWGIWLAGGHPFKNDSQTSVTINLNDDGSNRWANAINGINSGLMNRTISSWSADWTNALGNGTLVSVIGGAWMGGVLINSVKQAGGGVWQAAPAPTFTGGPSGTSEHGGSSFVVMQNGDAKNKLAAAGFVKWITSSQTAMQFLIKYGLLPPTKSDLSDPSFINGGVDYFGGQAVNKVYADASNNINPGFEFLPYALYANTVVTDTVYKALGDGSDMKTALAGWQKSLVDYGTQQGYTVKS